jgi:hypothetical protein
MRMRSHDDEVRTRRSSRVQNRRHWSAIQNQRLDRDRVTPSKSVRELGDVSPASFVVFGDSDAGPRSSWSGQPVL